jgi:diacylglycerol kinase family enzyme
VSARPRVALLVNRRAGSADSVDPAVELRRLGTEVCEYEIDDIDAALEAAPERLIVAGGDGSLGPIAAAAGRAGVPLAVVPAGTANDFARVHRLPADPERACELAARGSKRRSLDLARIDGRPFVNVASLGLAPVAARRAAGLKRVLGSAAYAVGAVEAGLRASPVRCAARCDGSPVVSGLVWQLTVACSGAFGAGAEVAADQTDGLLDLVAIPAASRLGLVRAAYHLRRGDIHTQEITAHARGQTAEVDADPGTEYNVDGEVVRAGAARFTAEHGAFELIVP